MKKGIYFLIVVFTLSIYNCDKTTGPIVSQTRLSQYEEHYKILFRHNNNIYTIHSDGTNLVQLTNTPTFKQQPTWSPDESKIAFVAGDPGTNMQIYIMNSDGENIQQLSRYSISNLNPQFTPDGDRVIYIADGLLYSRKIDGTDITYHQAQLGSEYSVHPFENKVLFSEIKNDSGYIFELDINTSAIRNIITGDYYIIDPVYFPNGSKIAYASNDDWRCNIFSINPDGSDKVQLTNLPHPNKVLTPVWSPDNFHILFQYWDGVDNGAVYQINNDGTSLIELQIMVEVKHGHQI